MVTRWASWFIPGKQKQRKNTDEIEVRASTNFYTVRVLDAVSIYQYSMLLGTASTAVELKQELLFLLPRLAHKIGLPYLHEATLKM